MVIITLIRVISTDDFPTVKVHANIEDAIQHCFTEARLFLKDMLYVTDEIDIARDIKQMLDDLESDQEEFTQGRNILDKVITFDADDFTFKAMIKNI